MWTWAPVLPSSRLGNLKLQFSLEITHFSEPSLLSQLQSPHSQYELDDIKVSCPFGVGDLQFSSVHLLSRVPLFATP